MMQLFTIYCELHHINVPQEINYGRYCVCIYVYICIHYNTIPQLGEIEEVRWPA